MTTLIHKVRIQNWLRQNIKLMGRDDFYVELFAAINKIELEDERSAKADTVDVMPLRWNLNGD